MRKYPDSYIYGKNRMSLDKAGKKYLQEADARFAEAVYRYFNSYGYFVMSLDNVSALNNEVSHAIEPYIRDYRDYRAQAERTGITAGTRMQMTALLEKIDNHTRSHTPHILLSIYEAIRFERGRFIKRFYIFFAAFLSCMILIILAGIPKELHLFAIFALFLLLLPCIKAKIRIDRLTKEACTISLSV